jgi:hypothetical protein
VETPTLPLPLPTLGPPRPPKRPKHLHRPVTPTQTEIEDTYDSEHEDLPTAAPNPSAAEARNEQRITEADHRDRNTLGKYLPTDPNAFLPPPIPGPDDAFQPPPTFLQNLQTVFDATVPTPSMPDIFFDVHPTGLLHNSRLLANYDYDVTAFLESQSHTTVGPGSEFRPLDQLELILGSHPNFPELAELVTTGMPYRYTTDLTEADRATEVLAMLARGNHKSAEDERSVVHNLLFKDVTHGFSMPIPPEIVPKLLHAMVQPFGVAKQTTLNDKGERVLKYRLTQDLSYSLTGYNRSVNSRIDMDSYVEMIYGYCLTRIIHYIVALRLKHPHKRILLSKYDYSDAYRRIAHAPSAAVQSIAVNHHIAYIALRLTFGGSPNPPTWCTFSEMVTDLSNEIILAANWDATTLRSPAQPKTPTPRLLPSATPIALAQPLAVSIPVSITCRTDGFIDDLITCFLDTPSNRERCPHATPLAMHLTSRPHAGANEPVIRRNILSDTKLIAEGSPAEVQIVLGWILNCRALIISLPTDKHSAWASDIHHMATNGHTSFGDLDTSVGRLNHASHIIPLARHFLNRLRLRIKIRQPQKQDITFSPDELADLQLWLGFLTQAHTGISLNQITKRQPSRLTWSDSCPFGVGGYNLTGRAWRFLIPPTSPIFGSKVVNNLLEFLGMVIGIWLICLDSTTSSECILALGDNTSAIGWLFKSGSVDPHSVTFPAIQVVARKLGSLMTTSPHCLASQHIKGVHNTVSDYLSYSGTARGKPHPLAADNPSDHILTQRFHALLPSQIPPTFNISPLPNMILSWVSQVLQIVESSLIRSKRPPTKIPTGSGAAGNTTAPLLGSTITPSSLSYLPSKKKSSSAPSSSSIAMPPGIQTANLQAAVANQWSVALCALPQAAWLRRFGSIMNQAPSTSRTAPSCSPPSVHFSAPMTTSTHPPTARKQSPHASCDACMPPLVHPTRSSVTALQP